MYTGNGGRSWGLRKICGFSETPMCPGYACLTEVDLEFVDSRNRWLAARAPLGMDPSAAYLYRTREPGRTWTALETPFAGQVTFVDAWTRWAFGGEGRGRIGGLSYTVMQAAISCRCHSNFPKGNSGAATIIKSPCSSPAATA